MLEISFYKNNEEPPFIVEVSEEIYEWFAKSKFSKIGEPEEIKKKIEGEEETLPLVPLDKDNREKLINFLLQEIRQEDYNLLTRLGDSFSKQEYRNATALLRKLHEVLQCIENQDYKYLQRV